MKLIENPNEYNETSLKIIKVNKRPKVIKKKPGPSKKSLDYWENKTRREISDLEKQMANPELSKNDRHKVQQRIAQRKKRLATRKRCDLRESKSKAFDLMATLIGQ